MLVKSFPYKGPDARSKQALLRSKKMKNKASRSIVGTFSEVSTFIRLLPLILYDHIDDPQNDHWLFLLSIRKFLRYVHMKSISSQQLHSLQYSLKEVLNRRIRLSKTSENGQVVPKMRWKEHFLCHMVEDIKNLAPLPLLATDLFESFHSPFKDIRKKARNSINILHTLSQKLSPHLLRNSSWDTLEEKICWRHWRKMDFPGQNASCLLT